MSEVVKRTLPGALAACGKDQVPTLMVRDAVKFMLREVKAKEPDGDPVKQLDAAVNAIVALIVDGYLRHDGLGRLFATEKLIEDSLNRTMGGQSFDDALAHKKGQSDG